MSVEELREVSNLHKNLITSLLNTKNEFEANVSHFYCRFISTHRHQDSDIYNDVKNCLKFNCGSMTHLSGKFFDTCEEKLNNNWCITEVPKQYGTYLKYLQLQFLREYFSQAIQFTMDQIITIMNDTRDTISNFWSPKFHDMNDDSTDYFHKAMRSLWLCKRDFFDECHWFDTRICEITKTCRKCYNTGCRNCLNSTIKMIENVEIKD